MQALDAHRHTKQKLCLFFNYDAREMFNANVEK